MSKKILILGVNGFIGHSLVTRILNNTDWEVYGMDRASDKLDAVLQNSRFHFEEVDITVNKQWIEYHITKCDIILPLVAIATPISYVREPLHVFSLDFESNLEVIRMVVTYKKRLIFPSTSEVYGLSSDSPFNEETSNLTVGPIHKQRWIYSCSKQLLDRIIYAYGVHEDLNYTIIRPFNWIGPRLDNIHDTKEGSTRVITQFISNIIHKRPIKLVNGGLQKRCFTHIDDGIDALMKIISNPLNCANRRIFNLGNPDNNYSIKELAEQLLSQAQKYPGYNNVHSTSPIEVTNADEYYGKYYQDMDERIPDISTANRYLGWSPKITLAQSIKMTLDYHLTHQEEDLGDETQFFGAA